ncbi:MAG: hypothetical protein KME60_02470 [Cyanomargarita calcarea GSE-NOS-MK-12-04C]|jgi:hypothetical protein|uniref:Uncharacterized protein n=1 Tax=Cyanomargarita calcarea GSE-NOS-MK-12-04C TaxID=2839659 RepID=A0A951QI65_9CYAN|nr:hypothetical protein [Cyanomargarita calcarea GSE-NOS-MK-12-04C]
MSKLEISDLSFCEVATEEYFEIKGGFQLATKQPNAKMLSLLKQYFPALSVDFSSGELESISPENTIEPIEDKANGTSGFTITSKDGKTKASLLNGPGFSFASASNTQTQTS